MFSTIDEFLVWIENQRRFSPKVSLDKMRSLCDVLGNPQEKLAYIHIGGTNGKGSTVSYVSNTLRAAGYNVGAFISPYVIEFNERISYNGMYISNAEVLKIANHIYSFYPAFLASGLELPTFFEFLTLMAFCYFAQIESLDVVVMEVGLGGLLDSTNIITPMVSAITNISYDHIKVLGDTLEEIARNKLGIAKKSVPMVTVAQNGLQEIFKEECSKKEAPLYFVEKEDITDIVMTLQRTTFQYKDLKNIEIKLLGKHQTENAALAIEIVRHLPNTYKVTKTHILKGLKETVWPGRLELVSKQPIVLLDGAHNIGGITRLAEFLEFLKQSHQITLIFAVSQDKEKNQMIEKIEHYVDEIVFSSFHYKRSDDASYLYGLSRHENKRIEEDLDVILDEIKRNNDSDQIAYVFCGSLYFISEVRTKFIKS